jgi:O-antigen/teichoic acid export membrane protein
MSNVKREATYLYVVHFSNLLLPLATLPYLTRVLGPEQYGRLGFAQAVVQFLVLLTNFGFDPVSARQVAVGQADREAVNDAYWVTLMTKSGLCAASLLILLALAWSFDSLRSDGPLLMICGIAVVASAITPNWLFQGYEKLSVFALATLVARILFLPLVFLLVRGSGDYLQAAALQALPPLIAGAWLTHRAWKSAWIGRPVRPRPGVFRSMVSAAFDIFSGSTLTLVYTYGNVILLRVLGGNAEVGYYVAAEKLITPGKQIFSPLVQACFARVCDQFSAGREEEARGLSKRLLLAIAGFGMITLVVGYFAAGMIHLLLGPAYARAAAIFVVLLPLPFLIGSAIALVQLRIIPQQQQAVLKRIYGVASIFHLLQAPWLVLQFGAEGTAVSVILTEAVVTALIYRFVLKYEKHTRAFEASNREAAVAGADQGAPSGDRLGESCHGAAMLASEVGHVRR